MGIIDTLRHWHTWVITAVIALLVALTVRTVAEVTNGDRDRLVALEDRVERIEKSRHPATTNRYTSDDAARDQARISGELGELRALIRECEDRHHDY
jgi:hypothetical protein